MGGREIEAMGYGSAVLLRASAYRAASLLSPTGMSVARTLDRRRRVAILMGRPVRGSWSSAVSRRNPQTLCAEHELEVRLEGHILRWQSSVFDMLWLIVWCVVVVGEADLGAGRFKMLGCKVHDKHHASDCGQGTIANPEFEAGIWGGSQGDFGGSDQW